MPLPQPQVLPPSWPAADRARLWAELPDKEQQAWLDLCRYLDWLMDQPQFRYVATVLLDDPLFCGIGRSTYDPSGARAAYLSGRRDVGLELQQHLMAIAPKKFMRMLHEQMNARRDAPPPKESDDA